MVLPSVVLGLKAYTKNKSIAIPCTFQKRNNQGMCHKGNQFKASKETEMRWKKIETLALPAQCSFERVA